MKPKCLLGAVVLVSVTPVFALGDEFWLGKQVMPKETCRPVNNGRLVPFTQLQLPSVVTKVEGDQLWIGAAWVNKSDMLLLSEAIAYYTRHLATSPNSAWANSNLGAVYLAEGKLDLALAAFDMVIKGGTPSATDFNSRGFVYYKKGELDAAIADFTEALRLDPAYVFALSNRGLAWKAKGEFKNALNDHSLAIRLDPRQPGHFNNRGIVWAKLGEIDRAIDDFNQALQLKPTYVFALTNRGDSYKSKGDLQSALADYRKAIEIDPMDAYAYRSCADVWATGGEKLRDGKQAVDFATKACELTRWREGESLQALAAALAETGDFSGAIESQHKAIELMRQDPVSVAKGQERLALYKMGKPYRR
ncbi:MAG: tetratricopeptide repeat protein [Pirellulales bacterium]